MTVTIATSIQGKINGKSVSISLTYSIANVVAYMDRTHRVQGAVQSLNSATPRPPNMDNAEVCFIRMGTVSGSRLQHLVGSSASEAVYHLDPGQCFDLYRQDAGGIIAQNATATTTVLETINLLEQTASLSSASGSLFVAFKPIS